MEPVLYYLAIWLVLAVVLNSENDFIIAKPTVWVWCGAAIMNGQIVYNFIIAKLTVWVWCGAAIMNGQ